MNKVKSTKGITLVALVVTIVVLLILAGITIVYVFGDNGVFQKAQEAKNRTENAIEDEKAYMSDTGNMVDKYTNGNDGDKPAEDNKPKNPEKGELVTSDIKYETYTDSTGSAPIPGGYSVVKDYIRDGVLEENKVGTGLVISDVANDDLNNSAGGNQFVWVPVPIEKLDTMYDETNNAGKLWTYTTNRRTEVEYPGKNNGRREPDIVAGNGTSYDAASQYYSDILGLSSGNDFAEQLQTEFNEMIVSVKEYKGFYIGRYETGNLEADKENVPVVQKGNSKINNVNWYYIYQTSKKIKANDNVKSSMIWGCQWDRTLEWLVETPNNEIEYSNIVYSTSWGNYRDYSSTTGDTSTASGGSNPQPSGTNEHWKANNIYDLAGNIFEWTLEASSKTDRANRRRCL